MMQTDVARWLVSVVLASSAVMSFVLDWSPNHLLNPLWHPHARFHGALLLFFLAGASLSCLWLIWRGARGSVAAIRASAAVMIAFWAPLFFIPFLLPGASWWAGVPGAEPRFDGQVVYPNLVVAAIMLAASFGVLWLCRRQSR